MNRKMITIILLCVLAGIFIYGIINLALPEIYERRQKAASDRAATEAYNDSSNSSSDSSSTGDSDISEGWQKIDGDTYYFRENGEAACGPTLVEGRLHYFDEEGRLLSGWNTVEDKTLYLTDEGTAYSGWLNYLGHKYYINSDGTPATGIRDVDGKTLTFNEEGQLITEDDFLAELESDPNQAYDFRNNELQTIGSRELVFSDKKTVFEAIRKTTKDYRYNISFIVMDMCTGEGLTYNIDQKYYSASAIKGPYIAALTEARPEMIDTNARAMTEIVMNSDNKLYSGYRRSYGRDFLLKLCEDLEIDEPSMVYNYPHISARDMAKFWIHDYYYFNTNPDGIRIRNWYESPNQSPIHAVFEGQKYTTQSKAGWICEGRYAVSNDAGIIYPANGHPFMIVICSDLPSDLESLEPLVRALGEVIQ